MFKNKKSYAICMVVETILPWLVLISGIPAMNCFWKSSNAYNSGNYGADYLHYESLFDTFYGIAMTTGFIVVIVEWILSMISFIIMVSEITDRAGEKCSIIKPLEYETQRNDIKE